MSLLQSVSSWPVDHVSAALIRDGKVLETIGDQDAVYELASVTKLVTAYGFLVAYEEGVFDLDDPVGPSGATVRHLLAHASGLGFDDPRPERAPGEKRIYSSAGFAVLAHVVEKESGILFPDYLDEAVCRPLNMIGTKLVGPAGHGMVGTCSDLSRFALEVLSPVLLSEQTVEKAVSIQWPSLEGIVPGYGMQKPCPWGLGFEIKGQKSPHWTGKTQPLDTVGHFGVAGTYVWIHRPTGTAMVALTDRPFGEWAKPLWAETNDTIWAALMGGKRGG